MIRAWTGYNRKAAACLVSLALLYSAVTAGVCICGQRGPAGEDVRPCIVSLDVCGAGGVAVTFQGLDGYAVPCASEYLHFPLTVISRTTPGFAVASAEPAESEKPPEA